MAEKASTGAIILDRRNSSRIPFETKARVMSSSDTYSAVTRDLTPSGAYLLTDTTLDVGTEVEVSFELRDDQPALVLEAHVVRAGTGPTESPGFGVEFDGIESEDAKRILAATSSS